MSKTWQSGSTTAWRALRQAVLDRDRWTCQLCHEPIPHGLAPKHPRSAQVHHTRDRRIVGDDPRYLQAAHRLCNQKAGQPGRDEAQHDVPDWLAARLRRGDDE